MKGIFIILALAIAAGVIAAMLAYSAKKIEVTDASVSEVTLLGIRGVILNGSITVHNGGFLSAKVDKIVYNATLGSVKGVFGNGEVGGGEIKAKESKEFPFILTIEWVPSIETALNLLTSNKTYVDVMGVAYTSAVGGKVRLEIPFSARANLEGYLEQIVTESPSLIFNGSIADIIGEHAAENAGYILDKIEGMIS